MHRSLIFRSGFFLPSLIITDFHFPVFLSFRLLAAKSQIVIRANSGGKFLFLIFDISKEIIILLLLLNIFEERLSMFLGGL